jgi:hypothetical protein
MCPSDRKNSSSPTIYRISNPTYQTERQKLQSEYRGGDRAKGFDISIDTPNGSLIIAEAKSRDSKTKTTSSQKPSSDFWERGDRVMVIAAGGALFGGMLAQIPGAIVGAILAGIYG